MAAAMRSSISHIRRSDLNKGVLIPDSLPGWIYRLALAVQDKSGVAGEPLAALLAPAEIGVTVFVHEHFGASECDSHPRKWWNGLRIGRPRRLGEFGRGDRM